MSVQSDISDILTFPWRLADYARNPMKRALAEDIAQRDGLACLLCVKENRVRETCKWELELDHADGDPHNWRRENMRLLGKGHNLSERNRQRSLKRKKEREKASRASVSHVPDEPITIAKNREGEPAYRDFIIGHLLLYGEPHPESVEWVKDVMPLLDPTEMLKAGSAWSGMNPKTCYPYQGRMDNRINGFLEVRRHKPTQKDYLQFRFLEYYAMTVEEIDKLNPKEGLKTRQETKA